MSSKSLLRLVAVVLTALFVITLLSGCKNKKYVYGNGSEFIEVSHPDKPNVNRFSQEESDDFSDDKKTSDNTSGTKSKSSESSGTESKTLESSSESKPQSQDDKSGSSTESSQSESSSSESNELGGDQSPVVAFK